MPPQPLAGRTILVTSPKGGSRRLESGLRALGARVLRAPVMRVAPPASYAALDAALRDLGRYDAAVFASANAVASFFSRARASGARRLAPPPKVYAVGPRTAESLRRRGWRAAVPKTHRAEALARAMGRVRGWRILLPRAEKGAEILPRMLRRKGARVDAITAYRIVPNKRVAPRSLAAAGCDVVTFTSGSTVEHLLAQLPAALRRKLLRNSAAASIGPATTAALRRRGVEPAIEAPRATAAALCRAIARHFAGASRER